MEVVRGRLLSNACKFTEEGGITVTVASEFTAGEHWVTFAVTDTGIGMSREYRENRLFQPGSRANRFDYDGHGLGLAISRNLCRLMGGDITAESEGEGKGSTFTIRLPARVRDSTAEPDRNEM